MEIKLEDIIQLKSQINTMMWRIKLAYQKDDGSYNVPEKYKKSLETLKNTLEMMDALHNNFESMAMDLSKERIAYAKSTRKVANLNYTIAEMSKNIKL